MTLKAVFFDLDGTLLDTALDLSAALNSILTEDKKASLAIQDTRKVVSDGAAALVKLGYGKEAEHPDKLDKLRQRLLSFYEKNLSVFTTAFDGIDELIKNLSDHDISWGVVTNKPRRYTIPLMAAQNFSYAPSCILSPEDVPQAKPHPSSLLLACKLSKCEPNEAIYIGDHKRDINCGKNANMMTIAANYGYISEQQDTKTWLADHYVESANDLWPIIQTYIR